MINMSNQLCHYGILGMKWGIRRYQNKDGSLTPAGKARLKITDYEKDHSDDIVLKRGTRTSRVVSTSRYDEYADPRFGGSSKAAKAYIQSIKDKERSLDTKYLSVDDVRNSGRYNGKDFYVSWFTMEGYEPNSAYVSFYALQKDAKIASGKKVLDSLLDEVGSKEVGDLLKNNQSISSLTTKYTTNYDLFRKVNQKLIDQGYDGIEDINDPDTDLPIILFNSKTVLGSPTKIQSGRDAVDEILNRYK